VLIGTQMVAKGLDLPRVTLVGVMAADAALNLPDFRSSERTFQLLTQVAGRAGRGDRPGSVIVQAYAPEHPSVELARSHDYESFAARELLDRREVGYPPFTQLAHVVTSAEQAEEAWRGAEAIARSLRADPALSVLGPAEAMVFRVRGRFRVRLLVKATDGALLRRAVRAAVQTLPRVPGLRAILDLDPVSLL